MTSDWMTGRRHKPYNLVANGALLLAMIGAAAHQSTWRKRTIGSAVARAGAIAGVATRDRATDLVNDWLQEYGVQRSFGDLAALGLDGSYDVLIGQYCWTLSRPDDPSRLLVVAYGVVDTVHVFGTNLSVFGIWVCLYIAAPKDG